MFQRYLYNFKKNEHPDINHWEDSPFLMSRPWWKIPQTSGLSAVAIGFIEPRDNFGDSLNDIRQGIL